jgi:hypothetical protein
MEQATVGNGTAERRKRLGVQARNGSDRSREEGPWESIPIGSPTLALCTGLVRKPYFHLRLIIG